MNILTSLTQRFLGNGSPEMHIFLTHSYYSKQIDIDWNTLRCVHADQVNRYMGGRNLYILRGKLYSDVTMGTMASQITSLTIVYSTVYSGADQRKYHSSASLAFVRGIHRWPVNSPHKGSVTRKMLPFDDVIMRWDNCCWWPGDAWRQGTSIHTTGSVQFE